MAIIRRMDLDADARLSKQEFIEGLKPEEPYSKMLVREKSKSEKKSKNKRGGSATFYLPRDDI